MESLTDCVLDTVALVKHLEDELPKAADKMFREAEAGRSRMYLPEIALGEFIYIAMRGRLHMPNPRAAIEEVVDQILAASYITLSHLSHSAWDVFIDVNVPDLHDRMIASDALVRGLPLITNDSALASVPGLKTIWR